MNLSLLIHQLVHAFLVLMNIFNYRCSNHDQFTKYTNFGIKLLEADDNDIYKMTGCLSSCHKSTFEIELSQQNENHLDNSKKESALQLTTLFPLSRYEVREQVCKVWFNFVQPDEI